MAATFDGWSMTNGPDALMHFRTKGSKNGVRRYQNSDGSWTPLGLRERRDREGFGKGSRPERRAEKAAVKAAKASIAAGKSIRAATKIGKKAAKAAARKAKFENRGKRVLARKLERAKNNPKNMSEAELKKRIEHIKLEQTYKEMTRSPILKTGEKAIKAILTHKARKLEAQERRAERIKDMKNAEAVLQKAKAEVARAKADKRKANADIVGSVRDTIDNLTFGAKRKSAKAELKKAKNEERKHTVRGAISQSLNNVIQKSVNSALKDGWFKRKAEERHENREANRAERQERREEQKQKRQQRKQQKRERQGRRIVSRALGSGYVQGEGTVR